MLVLGDQELADAAAAGFGVIEIDGLCERTAFVGDHFADGADIDAGDLFCRATRRPCAREWVSARPSWVISLDPLVRSTFTSPTCTLWLRSCPMSKRQ